MNSRERVLSALDHVQPDRIPVDLSSHRSSGISAIAYPKLRQFLGLPPKPVRVYDMIQQLAVVDEDILDFLGVDTIEMGRGFLKDEKDWKKWVLPDGTPCLVPYYVNVEQHGDDWLLFSDDGVILGIQKKGCLYFEQSHYPLRERAIDQDDFSDLAEKIPQTTWTGVPHPGAHLPLDEKGLAELVDGAKALHLSTDRAVVGIFGGNMFEIPQMLYGMEDYLTALALHPEAVLKLSESLCAVHISDLEKWLGAVGRYIDIVLFGDDLGGQKGPLISPGMYRKFYKSFHKELWQKAKEIADVKVMLHCCGGVKQLLPDLIDAGLDAINPVQTSAAGMDAASLKSEFGGSLTLWGGGCDTQEILPKALPEDIRQHVKRQMSVLSRGGGFVFQQVHNIQADVPPENIAAMFEAVMEANLMRES